MDVSFKKTHLLLCCSDQVVNESCYQGDDSVLKSLVEIADTAPKYLRPNLEATLQLCLKVSQEEKQVFLRVKVLKPVILSSAVCRNQPD